MTSCTRPSVKVKVWEDKFLKVMFILRLVAVEATPKSLNL